MKITNEADAWRYLARQYESGEYRWSGLCCALNDLRWGDYLGPEAVTVGEDLYHQMETRQNMLYPRPYDERDGLFWWSQRDIDSRILACCLLADLAEDGVMP